MMLSQRATAMPTSPIRRLVPLAEAAKRAGKTVYHLNIGQPDIPTPPAFFAGLACPPEVLAYHPSQGLAASRRALAAYYARHGIALAPEEILITAGGSEAIVFAMLAVCDAGDELLVPEPFYANYKGYAVLSGVKLVPITTQVEAGFHLPPAETIAARVTPRTRGILFSNPGNPTGTVYSREELERLGEIAREHDLVLIADEVYREFVYDGREHVSALHLPELAERVILVDSLSKRYSACGARLGCLATHDAAVYAAALKLAQARLSPPALAEFGLLSLLADPNTETAVREMIARFQARRDVLYEGLLAIPGLRCCRPEGAFYITVKLPVEDAEDFARWLLEAFELEGETVMLAPAADFYATPGQGRDEVRIAYVLAREKLRRALQVLRAGLEAYPRVAQPTRR